MSASGAAAIRGGRLGGFRGGGASPLGASAATTELSSPSYPTSKSSRGSIGRGEEQPLQPGSVFHSALLVGGHALGAASFPRACEVASTAYHLGSVLYCDVMTSRAGAAERLAQPPCVVQGRWLEAQQPVLPARPLPRQASCRPRRSEGRAARDRFAKHRTSGFSPGYRKALSIAPARNVPRPARAVSSRRSRPSELGRTVHKIEAGSEADPAPVAAAGPLPKRPHIGSPAL